MPNDSSHISSHSSISHFGTLIICVSGWDSMCELIDQWINWSRQEPFWYNRKEPQERISPCECLSVHAVQDQSINVCINIPIILLCCKELIQFSWLKVFWMGTEGQTLFTYNFWKHKQHLLSFFRSARTSSSGSVCLSVTF